ncbi:MAG: TraR/DksA family transcriptional regulator [Muribaculaceae bacterium]|nr:TraR/DksA family transcriptional regulator [Muribaculaceae bacterium]
MTEKTRYTEEELQEFKALILSKLDKAQKEFEELRSLMLDSAEDTPTFKVLEEGANTLGKEEACRLCERQRKFIENLRAALIRIENGTYGVCRATGKLIPKERLMAVPHATLCIEAKQ